MISYGFKATIGEFRIEISGGDSSLDKLHACLAACGLNAIAAVAEPHSARLVGEAPDKINAIKDFRTMTGAGLKQSKDIIEGSAIVLATWNLTLGELERFAEKHGLDVEYPS